MRILFLGSGSFAIPSLEALLDAGHEVPAVVTQPDKRKGRGRSLAPPPLKPFAREHGIPVLQPARVRSPEAVQTLSDLKPELQVVVAYGQILPASVIDIPPRGTVNVHASLLPAYRGAAPIQWALVNGEQTTGVTTMMIDEGLDTGPLLLSRATEIAEDETAVELEARLARLGAGLLIETVQALADGSLHPVPQDETRASLAPLIHKHEGRLDWRRPALELANRIRGFTPWPGASTRLQARTLKILRARPGPAREAEPGQILAIGPDGILVACGAASSLLLIEVQPESRRPMPATAFAAGARLAPGTLLDGERA